MPAFSLFPAFVRIVYQSSKGVHTMTRPTRAWTGTPWASSGTYTAWDESTETASAMITDLITAMLPLFTDDVQFTSYTIYTVADAESAPIPVWAANLTGYIGTSISTAQHLAYAKTYTYLTADSHIAKLVLLDVPTGGVVSKSTIKPSGAEGDLIDMIMDVQYAWAGRDDAQPVAFRSVSNDVNDALQKKYNL